MSKRQDYDYLIKLLLIGDSGMYGQMDSKSNSQSRQLFGILSYFAINLCF